MKVVILAGGFGTRISEESHPKRCLVLIAVIVAILPWDWWNSTSLLISTFETPSRLGYKQYVIKEYFADYFLHTSDITFDLSTNEMQVHNNYAEPWKVTLVLMRVPNPPAKITTFIFIPRLSYF